MTGSNTPKKQGNQGNKRGKYARAEMKKAYRTRKDPEGEMSYEEIAKVMNLSVNEVKRIEQQALAKLQAPTIKNRGLYEYDGISNAPQLLGE